MSAPVPVSAVEARRGLLMTAASFVIWGLVPLYWHLLKVVPSLQIIAHRIVWSAVLVVAWLVATSGLRWWRTIAAQPGALWMLAGSSVAIAFNWGLYIWAINAGHVIEASLGYFINPLLSVLLGVLVLKERLRGIQWLAVVCAAIGVLWLTIDAGAPPWIALGLAVSFGMYGLLRKLVAVDAVAGLGVESVYLFVPAVLLAAWGEHGHGGAFFSGWDLRTDLLLIFGGVVTAVPLIGFAYGVRRIALSLVGILQYIGPSLQLLLGVWFFHEPFDQGRAIGFAAIWVGLLLFVGDSVVRTRQPVAVR
ncbi:EamA family transporter RarD [Xanthomonas campestris]|uniref:EamA family transporter RarD n=1 Tax=Xanthomonas campestris TaxID=339 RepID=UPI00094B234A|nr:EamA family transporter RarD [Xanthomonas campestris]MEB1258497.1 EamA family transporter RarD [Xanthomonas campestris pv. campestris]MEB1321225.1 EamA family transporter RarD [Xanthomonas campestris pv. campestris]MEB1354279.1 EamA family transporter RarD [Xanthomonas campestris pv. campestris]MEB1422857.1 EamA family transporter RarD [Xanthomonas campestris pv. campestris]MEB1447873.1 EamA family transporter RarD [Xanthomonas campestris pv. campestris]